MIEISENKIIISPDSINTPQRRDEINLMKIFAPNIRISINRRRIDCTNDFKKHIAELTYVSDSHCEYLRKDGSIAYYNPYSIRKMGQIEANLDTKDYYSILADSFMCNQIIKALISYYNCPESLQTKYDDLIAVLLDHIMQEGK